MGWRSCSLQRLHEAGELKANDRAVHGNFQDLSFPVPKSILTFASEWRRGRESGTTNAAGRLELYEPRSAIAVPEIVLAKDLQLLEGKVTWTYAGPSGSLAQRCDAWNLFGSSAACAERIRE